ncbi:MAG: DUF4743 domain-containing protein [Rhodospirillaceae bacterium]
MSYLDRVKACNTYRLSEFVPFLADGQCVGWIQHAFAKVLAEYSDIFVVTNQSVTISENLQSIEERNAAINALTQDWIAAGWISKLLGETYPVRRTWASRDHFTIDRALVPLFGTRAYGVHLNGYVKKSGRFYLWIGTRNGDRHVEPNKLDNMVAGGQPVGLSLRQNLIKECNEEATIPATLVSKAIATGTVSYCFEDPLGLKADTLFCYDLAVPEDFTPENQDGEISGFQLMPIEEVLLIVRESTAFKFNVSLVILDFAIRHGVISPDSEPDYEEILAGLHSDSPIYHAV